MASSAALAPSTTFGPLQTGGLTGRVRDSIERWLEAERDQLPLWLPVMLGAGVAVWFVLPTRDGWLAAIAGAGAVGCAGIAMWRGGRAGVALAVGALAVATGLALAWARAEMVAAPLLTRPTIATFTARIERVEPLPARELVRLRLAPTAVVSGPAGREFSLPPRIRVNLAEGDAPVGLVPGTTIHLRARLMPPPSAAVPGAYDFARVAWFAGIGATGRGYAPVKIVSGGGSGGGLRQRLSHHIQKRLPGSEGGIASALATGDTGAIADTDADAMRRAGLAHLLSVSGLHITAVVGLTMLVVLRLLALSPWLALTFRLPLVAAGAAALVAIGYTLLTGAEVPTIRSCIAALLVLAALALGREAITLRLVAAGAFVVLLIWPESLAGPSFQLSFAAVTAIIALHEHPRVRGWFLKRDETRSRWLARSVASLLLTGLVVEAALMPIAVYHFHKAGIYGAFANIVAIPLTTFVVMPLEALALALDWVGAGIPVWWLTERALALLLWIAHRTASAPGAVAALPAMPDGAYALMAAGGLWLALWRTRWRRLGLVPLVAGAAWALATPPPDLLVTNDGRHAAVRMPDGGVALLRDRAGDYVQDTLTENGGVDGDPVFLVDRPEARCSRDLCVVERRARGRGWSILATRSAYMVPIAEIVAACRSADIAISERRLPPTCRPRWLKLDRDTLAKTGGVAVTLSSGRVETVLHPGDEHPWRAAALLNRSGAGVPRAYPGREPGRGRSAADRKRGWRDRGGSSRPRGGNI